MAAAAAFLVVFSMVAAHDIRIKRKCSRSQSICCRIGIAGHTAIEPDTGSCQRRLGAAANTTADQSVYVHGPQDSGESAMPVPLVSTISEDITFPSCTS